MLQSLNETFTNKDRNHLSKNVERKLSNFKRKGIFFKNKLFNTYF